MAMWRGFLVSLVLNTAWTAMWMPSLIYIPYWDDKTHYRFIMQMTLFIPGLINGLTLKMYFYHRLEWKDVLIIAVLVSFSMMTLVFPIGLITIFIFARSGLNRAFGALRGTFMIVLTVVACIALFISQFLVLGNFYETYTDTLPGVVLAGIGLGALNAMTFHVLVMVAQWLGRPHPQPKPIMAEDSGTN